MAYWEFLIQREGDRGWRSVKTGNLQLVEGTYRIIAKSDLTNVTIQTRVTHQTFDSTASQQRSQPRTQTTNAKGLLAILPPTHLLAGIWQFVCSGEETDRTAWHRILKLRVLPSTAETRSGTLENLSLLPLTQSDSHTDLLSPAVGAIAIAAARAGEAFPQEIPEKTADLSATSSSYKNDNKATIPPEHPASKKRVGGEGSLLEERAKQFMRAVPIAESEDRDPPTQPLVPISTPAEPEPETWADGLTRLLEQIERESLQSPRSPTLAAGEDLNSGSIQIRSIVDLPSQLISLNRSTFSSVIPGNRLAIGGQCNLHLLNPRLIQRIKVEKLAICLRHPQTSEIVTSIECELPADLDRFAFDGRLDVPCDAKISLLLGEVNLYDKHHIQVGTSGFTVTLNLSPLHESDLSLLRTLDLDRSNSATALERLNRELQIEAAAIGSPLLSPQIDRSPQPTIAVAYEPESLLEQREDIVPVETLPADRHPRYSSISRDITGDLEIDFAAPQSDFFGEHRRHYPRNYKNLEVVVDD